MTKTQIRKAKRLRKRRQEAAKKQRGGTKIARAFAEFRRYTGIDYARLVPRPCYGRRSERQA